MTELIPFDFKGMEVRTVVVDGEPWFVARDVCAVLDIANGRDAISRLDSDGVGTTDLIDSMGRRQTASIVNESGLYELIFQSRKTEAKAFRRWVTHDVLPAIRKTGSYSVAPAQFQVPQDLGSALRLAADEHDGRIAAERRALELEGPAAQAETFRAAEGLCTIGDLANRFQQWALESKPAANVLHRQVFEHAARLGLIIRGNTVRHNQGTSQAIKAGWIKHNRVAFDTNTRGMQTKVSVRLTSKGEARLWDGLITWLADHPTLDISKEIAS